jgi:hypothetical protein
MSDINKIIEEDRRKYPNCSYSYSSSRTCNNSLSDDGDNVVCKVVEQITRSCPNTAPLVIYSVNKTDSQKAHLTDGFESDLFHSSKADFFPNMKSLFPDFFHHEKMLQDFLSNDYQMDERARQCQSRSRNERVEKKKKSVLPFDGDIVGPSETI